MKKALIIAIYSLLCGLFFVTFLPAGQATVMGVYPGDLIKLQNDHNPATTEDEVVYYFDKDWYRRPFPNRKVYLSWYEDFSGVKELTREQLAEIRLGGNIVYRPGTRLIKIPSVPKVYAVEPHGVLRWVETEAVAKALYGDNWAQRVDDVSEAFFVNYTEGAPLTVPVWPTGSLVRRAGDAALYYVDGLQRRHLMPDVAASLRFQEAFILAETGNRLADYTDAGTFTAEDTRLADTAQVDYVDTLPPPELDFPVSAGALLPGQDQALYVFRLTSGVPVSINRIKAVLRGPMWSGSQPLISDLRFVDVNGVNLFGTKQLQTAGATLEELTWEGAYIMAANQISVIELRGKVAAGWPASSSLEVSMDRGIFRVVHGRNSSWVLEYYPPTAFPTATLTVH